MKFSLLILILLPFALHAECVQERNIYGFNLETVSKHYAVYVKNHDERYIKLNKISINPVLKYSIQLQHKDHHIKGGFDSYNRRNIEYYRYGHVQKFMQNSELSFSNLGYETVIVGQSLLKRDLYSVRPSQFDPNKKTIVMFGRHHGDEGTANWIIEGFIKDFLSADESFHKEYQLVLYPMINPDGAEEQTRYNDNGRDLNRSWSTNMNETYDEAKTIHMDLKKYLTNPKQVVIALDMHGSFTEDFIYRVKKKYISTDFFNHQQQFISSLGMLDQWQNGNFELSNGHKKMARIVLINSYNLHALTHETPRDIKLKNSKQRSKLSLMKQGTAIFSTIKKLY